jgi:hypothetical protein
MAAIETVQTSYTFDYRATEHRVLEAGLTFTQVGAYTHRSFGAARGYLKGDTDPPAAWVCAVAALLGVAPGELFRPVAETDIDTVVAVDPRPRVARNLTRQQRLVRRSTSTTRTTTP